MADLRITKKGDIVAISVLRSTTYAFGSGRGTETRTVWSLARVERAGRDGTIRLLSRAGSPYIKRTPRDLRASVLTISAERQAAASRVFSALTWENCEFQTQDDLRAAILAAV